MPDLDCCDHPTTHHRRNDDGTPGACAIDQCPCMGPAPAFAGEQPPNRYELPSQGPGQTPAPDADLADVLVNYDEVFQAVHMRHLQDRAILVQENAELRAGFNQAVARMKAAEAETAALRAVLAGN